MEQLFELSAALTLEMDEFIRGLQRAEQSAKDMQRLLDRHTAAAASGLTTLQSTAGGVWHSITAAIQGAINKTKEFLSIQGEQRVAAGGVASAGLSSSAANRDVVRRSYATGLNYVPYDNFEARLHQGEAVLTRLEAARWRAGAASHSAPAVDPQALAQAVAQALQGTAVQLDGQTVGRLITPAVSAALGRESSSRRYTG